MLLQPIMDPLARSDVSIGQSPCDLVPARPKLSVQMPFRDRKGVGTRATVIPAGFWRADAGCLGFKFLESLSSAQKGNLWVDVGPKTKLRPPCQLISQGFGGDGVMQPPMLAL